jgi:hypothetical protein
MEFFADDAYDMLAQYISGLPYNRGQSSELIRWLRNNEERVVWDQPNKKFIIR